MNGGAIRGLGLAARTEPSESVWIGGNPMLNGSNRSAFLPQSVWGEDPANRPESFYLGFPNTKRETINTRKTYQVNSCVSTTGSPTITGSFSGLLATANFPSGIGNGFGADGGVMVIGSGIPAGTVLTSANSTTITLSNLVTSGTTQMLTFEWGGSNILAATIEDWRVISTSTESSQLAADNATILKVWGAPQFTGNVSDQSLTGIGVSGFIGGLAANGLPTPSLPNSRWAAFACHWDSNVTSYGLYAFQAHLGMVQFSGQQMTEVVGFDVNALNSFGATAANVIGFRLATGTGMASTGAGSASGSSTFGWNAWGFQIGFPSTIAAGLTVGAVHSTVAWNTNIIGGSGTLDLRSTATVGSSTGIGAGTELFSRQVAPLTGTTANITVSTTAGSNIITSSAAFGPVSVGMQVYSFGTTGIPDGAYVNSISSTSSLTLSEYCTATGGPLVVFANPPIYALNCRVTPASTTIKSVGGFGSVVAGMYVGGPGIVSGTTVSSVTDANTVVLSTAASAVATLTNVTLEFFYQSPARRGEFLAVADTTSASAAVLFVSPAAGSNKVSVYEVTVWARRTGGSSGTADDAVGFYGQWLVSNNNTISPYSFIPPIPNIGQSFANTTATWSAAGTSLTGTMPANIVGALVIGAGIPAGTYCTARAGGGGSCSISKPAAAAGSGTAINFYNMPGNTYISCTTVANSYEVTSAALFGSVQAGMAVAGPGLPFGTYVVAVNTTSSITLNNPVAAAYTAQNYQFCQYWVNPVASIFGHNIQVFGPASTNVTWHMSVRYGGPLIT